MSLIIGGMDMPESCLECPFTFEGDCTAYEDLTDVYSLELTLKERHPKCRLKEIPTTHGRLIDSDVAITRLKHLYCDGCGCDCSTCPWGAFIKYLDGRPTIIEAEKYGEVS